MALDPRFTVNTEASKCPGGSNKKNNEASARKSFFGALGKVGDIEVLNRFGDGKITSGLRTMAKLSNSVRTGSVIGSAIDNSANFVLDAVGINANAAEAAGAFNPGVLNRGVGQAEAILDEVKRGNYKLENIPDTFQNLQNLDQLIQGIFNDGSGQASTKSVELCGATPYAMELINYAPKYKFLFIVDITLSPEYASAANTANMLAFVVKSSTRPNINIEHEEINMYNFWTRVPKRTIFEPITMRFYDDNKGFAHMFYTSYLRSISPITRNGGMGKSGILNVGWLEANSMKFNNINVDSTASITALEGNNTSIINELRVYHIYDYGKFMNVYHYHHPKLLSMNLDDLDVAENGGGNEIEIQFGYDALHITPALSIQKDQTKVKELTGDKFGTYPITPNFNNSTSEIEYLRGLSDEDDAHKPTSKNILTDVKTAVPQRIQGTTFAQTENQSAAIAAGNIPMGSVPSVTPPEIVGNVKNKISKVGNAGGQILKDVTATVENAPTAAAAWKQFEESVDEGN